MSLFRRRRFQLDRISPAHDLLWASQSLEDETRTYRLFGRAAMTVTSQSKVRLFKMSEFLFAIHESVYRLAGHFLFLSLLSDYRRNFRVIPGYSR
jgi:hypothetical protein